MLWLLKMEPITFTILDRSFTSGSSRMIDDGLIGKYPFLSRRSLNNGTDLKELTEYETDEFLDYMGEIDVLVNDRQYDGVPKFEDVSDNFATAFHSGNSTNDDHLCIFLDDINRYERVFGKRLRKCSKCGIKRSLYEYGFPTRYRNPGRFLHERVWHGCYRNAIVDGLVKTLKLTDVTKYDKLTCEKCNLELRVDDFIITRRNAWKGYLYKAYCNLCILDGLISLDELVKSKTVYITLQSWALYRTSRGVIYDTFRGPHPEAKQFKFYKVKFEANTGYLQCTLCDKLLSEYFVECANQLCEECAKDIFREKIDFLYTNCGVGHWRANKFKLDGCPECGMIPEIDEIIEGLNEAHVSYDLDMMKSLCKRLGDTLKVAQKKYV